MGDKWKVLIVRDLLTGTKCFGELRKSLAGISQKVLTQHLRIMEGNWVYGWILSFGEFIEVLEPEHIRKIIKDKVRKMYRQYEQKQMLQLAQSNSELLDNIEKLHTTELGKQRIKKNLGLNKDDIVAWCKEKISSSNNIFKKGKNFYVDSGDCTVTINAHSFTIITAHKNK